MNRSNVWPIIKGHWATMVDPLSRKPLKAEIAFQLGVPGLAGIAAWFSNPTIVRSDLGSLLAVVGILTGLLFQLLISTLSVLQREAEAEVSTRSVEKSRNYVELLTELDANISYAVLIGCTVAAGLAVALLFGSGDWRHVGVGILAVLLTHFFLTMLMILKRYRAIGAEVGGRARHRILRSVPRRNAS